MDAGASLRFAAQLFSLPSLPTGHQEHAPGRITQTAQAACMRVSILRRERYWIADALFDSMSLLIMIQPVTSHHENTLRVGTDIALEGAFLANPLLVRLYKVENLVELASVKCLMSQAVSRMAESLSASG
jgi:hypothetical protein